MNSLHYYCKSFLCLTPVRTPNGAVIGAIVQEGDGRP